MSRYNEIEENLHTMKLEKLSNLIFLYEGLRSKYCIKERTLDNKVQKAIERYEDKIVHYYNIVCDLLEKRNAKPNEIPSSPQDLAKPVNSTSELKKIAEIASIYFQQGLEMYLTSMKMNVNSAPLVEYYSFLQCVKGAVILDLEIKDLRLFSNHGLSPARKSSSTYLRAKVKPFGVFQTLLLLQSSKTEIDQFLYGQNILTLESLIQEKLVQKRTNSHTNEKPLPNSEDYAPPAFIVSWILSSLVRYYPKSWQKIYLELDEILMLKIHDYRRKNIPDAIDSILPYFGYPTKISF